MLKSESNKKKLFSKLARNLRKDTFLTDVNYHLSNKDSQTQDSEFFESQSSIGVQCSSGINFFSKKPNLEPLSIPKHQLNVGVEQLSPKISNQVSPSRPLSIKRRTTPYRTNSNNSIRENSHSVLNITKYYSKNLKDKPRLRNSPPAMSKQSSFRLQNKVIPFKNPKSLNSNVKPQKKELPIMHYYHLLSQKSFTPIRTPHNFHKQVASKKGYRTKYQKDPKIYKNQLGSYSYEDSYKVDAKNQNRIISSISLSKLK